MITEGLENEVKSLIPYSKLNSLQTVGYKEWFGYWNKKYSYEKTVELIKRNTRRYAKRQMTWNKKIY
jgi:tRNA dimethylallyltransferase